MIFKLAAFADPDPKNLTDLPPPCRTKVIDAGLVGELMMQVVEKRFGSNGKPPKTIEWLTDNGSCYTAEETRSFAKELGLKPVTTPVTSPQSNGTAESFVKTLKRDYAKLANRPN
jgi:putative transposase